MLKNVVFFADYRSTLFFDTNDRKIIIESLNLEIFYGSVVSFRSCDQENNVACLIVANIAKHHVPTVYLNRIVAYYEHTMKGSGPSLF